MGLCLFSFYTIVFCVFFVGVCLQDYIFGIFNLLAQYKSFALVSKLINIKVPILKNSYDSKYENVILKKSNKLSNNFCNLFCTSSHSKKSFKTPRGNQNP